MDIRLNFNRIFARLIHTFLIITLLISSSITIAGGAKIEQATAEGRTRADACMSATRRAESGNFSFLESQGRIKEVKKECSCDQDKDGNWSCMASIAYVEKDD